MEPRTIWMSDDLTVDVKTAIHCLHQQLEGSGQHTMALCFSILLDEVERAEKPWTVGRRNEMTGEWEEMTVVSINKVTHVIELEKN